uniref:NADH-ubiquinone oxidoreductase chain 2 n=1 Tax=Brentisentis yangtzensis TaxID=2604967 RepID=A0A5B9RGW9_9BILA|nr:NADH dehydrogenase subunit 2 [Brentisentis yangtzensis]
MGVSLYYKNLILVLYVMVLMVVVGVLSPVVVWVGLEMCVLFTLGFMYVEKVSMEVLFSYYLVQASSSLVMVMGMLGGLPAGFVFGLSMKLGLMPYFWWVVEVLKGMKMGIGVFLVLGLQKILPIILFSRWFILNTSMMTFFVYIVSVFSMFIGLVMMLSSYGLVWVLAGSSMVYSSWIMVFSSIFPSISEVYLIVYLIFVGLVVWGSIDGVLGVNSWVMMVFSSVPPMTGFILKMYGLLTLNYNLIMVVLTMIMISSMSSVAYLRSLMLTGMESSLCNVESGVSSRFILSLWGFITMIMVMMLV